MTSRPAWFSDDLIFLDERCPLPLDRPFTADQASRLGVSRWFLRSLVSRHLVRPVLRGAFVAAQAVDTVDLRAAALRLVVPESAIVTDRTAGWLHGVDTLPRSAVHVPPPLDVFSADGSRLRRPGVLSGIRAFTDEDVTEIDGVRVTTPLRTALDLGRRLPRGEALAALDGFLRFGVPHEVLLEAVGRFRGQRGVVQLRFLVPLADGLAESPGESALRLWWYLAGLPKPELQWWVYDENGVALYRLDLALPECRFAAEFDGERFHCTPEQIEHDQGRRDWLQQKRHWTIEVFVGAEVFPRAADPMARLASGLRTARTTTGLWVPESAYR